MLHVLKLLRCCCSKLAVVQVALRCWCVTEVNLTVGGLHKQL
jgi:hypothetical protein